MYRIFADVAADSSLTVSGKSYGFFGMGTITLNAGSTFSVTAKNICVDATKLVLAGLPKEISLSGSPIFHSGITFDSQDSDNLQIADLVERLEALRGITPTEPFKWDDSITPSPAPDDNTPHISYNIWYPVMGAEAYWAEAPGAETAEGDAPTSTIDKENPSMGGARP